jgi:hypothetical protein
MITKRSFLFYFLCHANNDEKSLAKPSSRGPHGTLVMQQARVCKIFLFEKGGSVADLLDLDQIYLSTRSRPWDD